MEPSELKRFEAVVLPHLDAAYGLARYLTRDDAEAEDVVQESMLRALKYFGGFRGAGAKEGRSWILTIVRNMSHTWRTRDPGPRGATLPFDETLHSEAVSAEHPDAALEREDTRTALARAIEALSPELREAIVLREVEGLSYKEIADVAGIPVGTVMSRLSRARARLQKALTDSDPGRR